MRKKWFSCKASIHPVYLPCRSPTPTGPVPGWQAESTRAESGLLHILVHGLTLQAAALSRAVEAPTTHLLYSRNAQGSQHGRDLAVKTCSPIIVRPENPDCGKAAARVCKVVARPSILMNR